MTAAVVPLARLKYPIALPGPFDISRNWLSGEMATMVPAAGKVVTTPVLTVTAISAVLEPRYTVAPEGEAMMEFGVYGRVMAVPIALVEVLIGTSEVEL